MRFTQEQWDRPRWRKRFAFLPKHTDCGHVVWLERYEMLKLANGAVTKRRVLGSDWDISYHKRYNPHDGY